MKSTSINPESAQTRDGWRGSALLLVIISLTLMAILGAAYIQIARVDRFSTREIFRENAIDSVVESALSRIQHTLREDVFDDNGNFFNPDNTAPGGDDEPYDYPYTANVANIPWEVKKFDGTLANAIGGEHDDTWLASTVPNFGVNPDHWPHITNLNGIFLRNVGTADMPIEDVVDFVPLPNAAPQIRTDTDSKLPIPADNDPDWVDADGDGIKDSRWTWAPVTKVGDVIYVMAVRIIDNSSLININAATAMTNNGVNGWGADSTTWPRGYFPTGIDLSRVLQRGPSNSWSTELADLLAARNVIGMPTPNINMLLPPDLPSSRLDAWWFNTRLYGIHGSLTDDFPTSTTGKFTIHDELELRHRGGLNNSDFTSNAERRMPTALLQNNEAASYSKIEEDPDVTTSRVEFIQGGDSASISDRDFPTIRHMLTAFSGASVFAPNHDDIHAGTIPVLKYDLFTQDGGAEAPNAADSLDPDSRVSHIADLLNTIFTIDGPGVTNAYLGLNNNTPNGPLINQIAHEFALAIQDYSDTDNTPSSWLAPPVPPNPAITYYGMEMLPFIREVYIQAEYENRDDKPLNNPDGKFETYKFLDGSGAMAIELGNPFEQDIPVSILNNIRVVVIQNGMEGSTAQITIPPTIPPTPPPTIPPHGIWVVYSVQDENFEAPNGGSKANVKLALDLVNIPSPPNELLDVDAPLTFTHSSDVTVGLQVLVNGTWVTYDRLTFGGFQFIDEYELPSTTVAEIAALPTAATPIYGQGSAYRPCTDAFNTTPNVYYLSNLNQGLNGAMIEPPNTVYDSNKHNFGSDNKGANGDPRLANFQLPLADRQFLSVAELGWIHMFGFSDAPNGDFPARLTTGTIADPTNDTRRWNLHFRTLPPPFNTTAVAVPNATSIPHAAMVMDQFTTLSPRYDGVDNDNDYVDGFDNDSDGQTDELDEHPMVNDNIDNDQDGDTDEDDEAEFLEQFVPGTINLNTVPLHIATLAAPLPENVNNVQNMMQAIANYRDNNTAANRSAMTSIPQASVRIAPGIASIGELMFINPIGNVVDYSDMQFYGNNDSDLDITNDNDPNVINLYPLPELQPTPYNPVDSAEEAMARFQFLSQAFTTRSDIFTAYVVIQGYPADDMSSNIVDVNGVPTSVPVESIRFFAVFDRSGMTTQNDQPRILGVYGLQ